MRRYFDCAPGSLHLYVARSGNFVVSAIDVVCQVGEGIVTLLRAKARDECHPNLAKETDMRLAQEVINFHETSRRHDQIRRTTVHYDLFM